MVSSSPITDEEDNDDRLFNQTRNTLSRLSICTNSKNHQESENYDGAEADGEVSDDDGEEKENVKESDSDKETRGFYSLPTTPSRRRRKVSVSDEFDDGTECDKDGKKCNLRRGRRVKREKKERKRNGGGREESTVLTRVKGGEKEMRMGLDEVKACRDLGFELEVPGRISVSTRSNFDTQTSSGGNSPIATWRISSPGDDPKEVKARLKVWAHAVALASSSRQA